MLRRFPTFLLLGLLLAITSACTNKKVQNPLANVGSKQPDKVLFDRAMDALKHNRFDVARMTFQTLINTYPDSEFIARAKLAVADSWYDEGGATALTQAEIEYRDFETFFPNMPEAAEAQLKIANIHYQQMEKADRDFTHAMHAEEEYRQMIMQYPDSKLVPEAKQRLMDVQEVLADREFRVGRFYYLRQSYPAAIARLHTLADHYPLFSQADEALYLLGQSYEGEVTMLRARKISETAKARMIEEFTKDAAEAYSRIITRYPVMDRAEDAKRRLEALHRPVPRPTKAAVAQNTKEVESRQNTGLVGQLMANFRKHPDVTQATKVGEPTLVDPTPMSATDVVQQATRAMAGPAAAGSGKNGVSVETRGTGAPAPNEAAPRSDAPAATDNSPAPAANDTAGTAPASTSAAPADRTTAPAASDNSAGATPAAGELVPNVPQNSNEPKPSVTSDGTQTLPPPQQVNEIQNGNTSQAAPPTIGATDGKPGDSASSQDKDQNQEVDLPSASSKHKKKKGLRKVVPF
jgi:outer membrane protein assembly factor BamD